MQLKLKMIFCEFGWGMDGRLLFMDSERNFFLRLSVTFKVCKGQTLLKADLVKTVIGIICGAVALALLLWAMTVAIAFIDNKKSENTYIETFITEG